MVHVAHQGCETHVRKSSAEERFNTSGSQEALQQVQRTDKPVKGKNGSPLKATEEQLERLVEHFEELLNRPTPETSPDIQSADTDLPIDCNKSYKTKIRIALNTLKNGTAAGSNEILAEAIKAESETAVNILHNLF